LAGLLAKLERTLAPEVANYARVQQLGMARSARRFSISPAVKIDA
jgi:hypothetical protein